MDTRFWTKAELYNAIDEFNNMLDIDSFSNYPLNSIEIAKIYCHNLTVEQVMFPTTTICGILCRDDTETKISLNSKRDDVMQNFDCMHEVMHYYLHEGTRFNCVCTETTIAQNRILEWQANEGAAQTLVPYQLFIPEYVSYSKKYAHDTWKLLDAQSDLAKMFNVTPQVIKNRIDNLEYEIWQYHSGVPIQNIELLSKTKIKDKGLSHCIAHYNYCTCCLGIINKELRYCHICGNDTQPPTIDRIFKTFKGVGYMIYNRIAVDNQYKATRCPKCDNENILGHGEYCQICGAHLINKCNGEWQTDERWVNGCDAILDGDSRYCPFCGQESEFYRQGFLKAWNHSNNDDIPF